MRYNIPEDYTIEYDPEKNYNEKNNSNYLPPYRSDYPSVYKGVEVEIHLVDHCNLNCNCCNHFSPLSKPWFITVEDFTEQMILLKNNISSLRRLLLLGGEPCLHPNFFELCKIAREILGDNIVISVITNGTIIKPIKEHKEDYQKLNIQFTFSSYFNKTKLQEIEELQPFGIVFNTRILSKATLVEPSGLLNGFDNFFNCVNHKLPCFTLRDKKLYICPFSAHLHIYCEKANISIKEIKYIDYLPVEEIQNNLNLLQKFTFTPKHICNYCSQDTAAFPFCSSYQDIIEYTWPLEELYLRDYDRYEQIINAGKMGIIKWAENKKLNPGRVDRVFETWTLEREEVRYLRGKIDIIIPYYNETISQLEALKENLLSQTIIDDCSIYLISDNGNMDLSVIRLFQRVPNLHPIFLRNQQHQGPGAARNIGIKNSHNKYLFFLDADDSFIKPTALEELYNKIENGYDLVSYSAYDNHKDRKVSFIVNRKFLNDNNLLFKNIFFGEDNEFYTQLLGYVSKEQSFDYLNEENIFLEYNKTKENNITSTFAIYDPLHFSYITSQFIAIDEIMRKSKDRDKTKQLIIDYINHLLLLFDDQHDFLYRNKFAQCLMYFIINRILYYYEDLAKDIGIEKIVNLFNFNEIQDLLTFEQLKTYLNTYIKEKYLNNNLLKTNAQYLIDILERAF